MDDTEAAIEQKAQIQRLAAEWWAIQEEVKLAKQVLERERALRNMLFVTAFPAAVEGVNKIDLDDSGYVLKGTHNIDRKIDEAALASVAKHFTSGKMTKLISYKPVLVVKEYKKLTHDQQKIFAEALIIKSASPDLEIVAPKGVGR